MRSRRAVVVLASLVLAGYGAGCGERAPRSDAEQVRALYRTYLSSMLDHDGATACASMTSSLQRTMLLEAGAEDAKFAHKSCAEAVEDAPTAPALEPAEELAKHIRVTELRVSGRVAHVSGVLEEDGHSYRYPSQAEKHGDRWLISCCVRGAGPAD